MHYDTLLTAPLTADPYGCPDCGGPVTSDDWCRRCTAIQHWTIAAVIFFSLPILGIVTFFVSLKIDTGLLLWVAPYSILMLLGGPAIATMWSISSGIWRMFRARR